MHPTKTEKFRFYRKAARGLPDRVEFVQRETATDPIVCKKCKHAFCCSCLVRFQNTNTPLDTAKKCPCCRKEITDLVEATDANICAIVARVKHGDVSEEERYDLAKKGLEDIQKLCDADPTLNFAFVHNRAILLGYRGEDNLALKELQAVLPEAIEGAERGVKMASIEARCQALNLNYSEELKKHNLGAPGSAIRKADLFDLYFHIVKWQKDWKDAAETYKILREDFQVGPDMNIIQEREVFIGAQECAYQLKDYIYAIQLGHAVLEACRFYPGVHRSTARAYRAMGEMEKARVLAARAILYEAPWDDENKKRTGRFGKNSMLECVLTKGLM